MSDLIKRSDVLKPYERLNDNDLISVKTIKENLMHLTVSDSIDNDGLGTCDTCRHFKNDEYCKGCIWDSHKHATKNEKRRHFKWWCWLR